MDVGGEDGSSPSRESSVGSNKEEHARWKEIYDALEYDADWGPGQDEELLQDIKALTSPPDIINDCVMRGLPYSIVKPRVGEGVPPIAMCRSIRRRIAVLRRRYEMYCSFLDQPGIKWNPRIRAVVMTHDYYYREKKETVVEHYFRTVDLPGYDDLRIFFGVQRAPHFWEEIHPPQT